MAKKRRGKFGSKAVLNDENLKLFSLAFPEDMFDTFVLVRDCFYGGCSGYIRYLIHKDMEENREKYIDYNRKHGIRDLEEIFNERLEGITESRGNEKWDEESINDAETVATKQKNKPQNVPIDEPAVDKIEIPARPVVQQPVAEIKEEKPSNKSQSRTFDQIPEKYRMNSLDGKDDGELVIDLSDEETSVDEVEIEGGLSFDFDEVEQNEPLINSAPTKTEPMQQAIPVVEELETPKEEVMQTREDRLNNLRKHQIALDNVDDDDQPRAPRKYTPKDRTMDSNMNEV